MSLDLRKRLSEEKKKIFALCNQKDFEAACSYNTTIFDGYTQKELFRFSRYMTKMLKKEYEQKTLIFKLIVDDLPPATASKEEFVEYLTQTSLRMASISLIMKAKAKGEKYNKDNFTKDMMTMNTRLLASLTKFFEKK